MLLKVCTKDTAGSNKGFRAGNLWAYVGCKRWRGFEKQLLWEVKKQHEMRGWRVKGSFTYHLLPSFFFGGKERIMVLCNVQMQKVLVGEVLPALLAPIHVRLLVVDIIVLERLEGERLVRGQRAFHDGRG